jgi:hypothetical protein
MAVSMATLNPGPTTKAEKFALVSVYDRAIEQSAGHLTRALLSHASPLAAVTTPALVAQPGVWA